VFVELVRLRTSLILSLLVSLLHIRSSIDLLDVIIMSNPVIHCVIDLVVKLSSTERVRSILMGILERIRKEDGCLKYKLFENLQDHCQFTIIGAWESEDAFEDHIHSDYFRQVDTDVKDDLVKTMDIKRYKYIYTDPDRLNDTKASGFCVLV
jgi:quinol monooxygenase YgiN